MYIYINIQNKINNSVITFYRLSVSDMEDFLAQVTRSKSDLTSSYFSAYCVKRSEIGLYQDDCE